MRVHVLAVGDVQAPLRRAVQEYEARARRYWKIHVVEVPAGPERRGGRSPEEVMAAEAGRLRRRLPTRAHVVALTRQGTALSSRELAAHLERLALESTQDVVFVIGGAFGIAPDLLRDADLRLTLSPLTLPHEIARLVLLEQLYRAGTILRNEPYHKGP